MVYIKPEIGTKGSGVMKVEQLKEGNRVAYRIQLGTSPHTFAKYEQLFQSVNKLKLKRSYLVQKGIRLLKYHNRFFDIRVMVQLSPRGNWETTGIIGRLAHPRKIVTNYHAGGTPLPLETLLSPYMANHEKKHFHSMLASLGERIAQHFHKKQSGYKEFGIDIGLDKELKPWIIEVNSRPDPYIFNQLKDKRMYRKIYRYAKAYGRIQ